MSDLGTWVAIATLAVALVGQWVRVNVRQAAQDARAVADKTTCDASLALLRSEIVAVEARVNDRVGDLRDQLTRIDGKVDRLLERHP